MFAVLVLLGLVVFVFGFIKLIISTFKRKPKKKPLIVLGAGFVMLAVGIAITPSADNIPSSTVATSSVTSSSLANTISTESQKNKESEFNSSQPQELVSSEQTVSSQIASVPASSIAHEPLPESPPIVSAPASSTAHEPLPESLPNKNEAEIEPQNLPDTPAEQVPPNPSSTQGQSYVPEQHETTDQEQVVYWGESGTKYHINPNCRSFQGNTPNSGSIEDAVAAGRIGWCGICSKGMK